MGQDTAQAGSVAGGGPDVAQAGSIERNGQQRRSRIDSARVCYDLR